MRTLSCKWGGSMSAQSSARAPKVDKIPVPNESAHRRKVFLAVTLPFVGFISCIVVASAFHVFNWIDLVMFLGFWVLRGLGITACFHRLLTHQSYKTGPKTRWALCAMGHLALQNEATTWVSTHREHHKKSDQEGDPHSPHNGGGFWFAHLKWMFIPEASNPERWAPDMLKDPIVAWFTRNYLVWGILTFLIPALLEMAIGLFVPEIGIIGGFFRGLFWGGLASVAFLQHITWSVNSVCHIWGVQPYETGDQSRDNWLIAILSFGEGYHNGHHALQKSARHGPNGWVDWTYAFIRLLELLGLAWDVYVPTKEEYATLRRQPIT